MNLKYSSLTKEKKATSRLEKILIVCVTLCVLIGKAQHRLISEDPVLNSVICQTQSTGSDGKNYEMVCMPLDYLNGWLFKNLRQSL